jgi:hypothetical protein
VALCPAQLYANYFHKVPFVLDLDLQRDSHQLLTQVSIARDNLAAAVCVATVKVKVKVKFTLEQATKAQRGVEV